MNNIGLNKSNVGLNTGKASNFLEPGIFVGDYLVPWGFRIAISLDNTPQDNMQVVIGALQAALVDPDPLKRAHFVGPYESFDDKSDAATEQTLGYGKKITTNEGKYNFDYTFDEGGYQYFASVRSYNGRIRQYQLIRIDHKGTVYGTAVLTNDSSYGDYLSGMRGFTMSKFFLAPWKPATYTTEAVYMLSIGISSNKEFNENLVAIETETDMVAMSEEYSVQDITILRTTSDNPAEITFGMVTAAGRINVVEVMPAIVTMDNFIVKGTAGPVAILSAVANPDNTVTVLMDDMDPNYALGDKATIALVDVETLATNGFKYYESNKAGFSMP